MLLGKLLKGDDAEASNHEMMALGPDLRTVVMSDVAANSSLRNELKTLLHEVRVEHGTVVQKHNKRKVKRSLHYSGQCFCRAA